MAIVAAGALLRFPTLGAQSFWNDESATWAQAQGSFWDVIQKTAADNYPPLHNLIVAVFIDTFGATDFVARLPSAIAGTATIAVLYGLVAQLHSRTAGLLAALVLALSGWHIWYSQEARTYALFALCATAFAWSVFRYFTGPRRGIRWMLVSGAALLYTHPFGLLTWISILVGGGVLAWGTRARDRVARFFIAQVLIGFAFLPWAYVMFSRAKAIHEKGFWIPAPTPWRVFNEIWEMTTGSYGLVLLVVGLVCLAVALSRNRPDAPAGIVAPRIVAGFLLCWALGLLALALIISVFYQPLFLARYLIPVLPAWIALAAIGLTMLAGQSRGWLTAVTLFAITFSTMALAFQPPAPRIDWRDAGALIEADGSDGDVVIMLTGDHTLPRRYLTKRYTLVVAHSPEDAGQALAAIPASSHRAFLVLPSGDEHGAAEVSDRFAAAGWTSSAHDFGYPTVVEFRR